METDTAKDEKLFWRKELLGCGIVKWLQWKNFRIEGKWAYEFKFEEFCVTAKIY